MKNSGNSVEVQQQQQQIIPQTQARSASPSQAEDRIIEQQCLPRRSSRGSTGSLSEQQLHERKMRTIQEEDAAATVATDEQRMGASPGFQADFESVHHSQQQQQQQLQQQQQQHEKLGISMEGMTMSHIDNFLQMRGNLSEMNSLSISNTQLHQISANLTQTNLADIIGNVTDADLRKQLMRYDSDDEHLGQGYDYEDDEDDTMQFIRYHTQQQQQQQQQLQQQQQNGIQNQNSQQQQQSQQKQYQQQQPQQHQQYQQNHDKYNQHQQDISVVSNITQIQDSISHFMDQNAEEGVPISSFVQQDKGTPSSAYGGGSKGSNSNHMNDPILEKSSKYFQKFLNGVNLNESSVLMSTKRQTHQAHDSSSFHSSFPQSTAQVVAESNLLRLELLEVNSRLKHSALQNQILLAGYNKLKIQVEKLSTDLTSATQQKEAIISNNIAQQQKQEHKISELQQSVNQLTIKQNQLDCQLKSSESRILDLQSQLSAKDAIIHEQTSENKQLLLSNQALRIELQRIQSISKGSPARSSIYSSYQRDALTMSHLQRATPPPHQFLSKDASVKSMNIPRTKFYQESEDLVIGGGSEFEQLHPIQRSTAPSFHPSSKQSQSGKTSIDRIHNELRQLKTSLLSTDRLLRKNQKNEGQPIHTFSRSQYLSSEERNAFDPVSQQQHIQQQQQHQDLRENNIYYQNSNQNQQDMSDFLQQPPSNNPTPRDLSPTIVVRSTTGVPHNQQPSSAGNSYIQPPTNYINRPYEDNQEELSQYLPHDILVNLNGQGMSIQQQHQHHYEQLQQQQQQQDFVNNSSNQNQILNQKRRLLGVMDPGNNLLKIPNINSQENVQRLSNSYTLQPQQQLSIPHPQQPSPDSIHQQQYENNEFEQDIISEFQENQYTLPTNPPLQQHQQQVQLQIQQQQQQQLQIERRIVKSPSTLLVNHSSSQISQHSTNSHLQQQRPASRNPKSQQQIQAQTIHQDDRRMFSTHLRKYEEAQQENLLSLEQLPAPPSQISQHHIQHQFNNNNINERHSSSHDLSDVQARDTQQSGGGISSISSPQQQQQNWPIIMKNSNINQQQQQQSQIVNPSEMFQSPLKEYNLPLVSRHPSLISRPSNPSIHNPIQSTQPQQGFSQSQYSTQQQQQQQHLLPQYASLQFNNSTAATTSTNQQNRLTISSVQSPQKPSQKAENLKKLNNQLAELELEKNSVESQIANEQAKKYGISQNKAEKLFELSRQISSIDNQILQVRNRMIQQVL